LISTQSKLGGMSSCSGAKPAYGKRPCKRDRSRLTQESRHARGSRRPFREGRGQPAFAGPADNDVERLGSTRRAMRRCLRPGRSCST
jgi:hypothetical protein